jgi:Fur family transcriptional regulator, iron response regulator
MVSRANVNDVAGLLKRAGLRPTRQRMALGQLLFGSGDRHLTAETLHMEAIGSSIPVSLATVYNTLHQFTEAGLLREVAVEGSKTYFDTNTSDHHHFYFERDGALMDIQDGSITVNALPEPPEGMEISRVDVLIRLVAKGEREREEG